MAEDMLLKLFEIMREALPGVRRVMVMTNPTNPSNPPMLDLLPPLPKCRSNLLARCLC
jgi:putative tryptophan/tyrosine transport system substrate-binding protein